MICVDLQRHPMLCLCFQAAASKPLDSGFEAKLCFAHAETIIPLVCLLGLFGRPLPEPEADMPDLHEQCSPADVQGNATSEYGQPELLSEPVLQQFNEGGISSSTASSTTSSRGSSNSDTCSSSSSSSNSSTGSSSRHCDSGLESFPEELVQEGVDGKGQAWVPPLPRPPLDRDWYGSIIAPYGANIQFALHRRTDRQVSGRHCCARIPCLP